MPGHLICDTSRQVMGHMAQFHVSYSKSPVSWKCLPVMNSAAPRLLVVGPCSARPIQAPRSSRAGTPVNPETGKRRQVTDRNQCLTAIAGPHQL